LIGTVEARIAAASDQRKITCGGIPEVDLFPRILRRTARLILGFFAAQTSLKMTSRLLELEVAFRLRRIFCHSERSEESRSSLLIVGCWDSGGLNLSERSGERFAQIMKEKHARVNRLNRRRVAGRAD
jgi:hypothetical protein